MQKKALKLGFKGAFVVKFNFDKSTNGIYKLNYPSKKVKST